MAYIKHDDAHPDPQRPPLLVDKCYHSLFKSHTHSLYKEDNTKSFELLEESLRGSSMNPTIQSYIHQKDYRKAWIALKQQYAGVDN